MGLAVGKVKLEKYNSNWEEEFIKEKEQLSKMFGDIAVCIEHVGSTAVVGISAKPIIDIAVGVNKLEDFEIVRQKFVNNKEYIIKENSEDGEILIRKGNESNRTHFIHIMEKEGERYKNIIRFRDILRTKPEILKEYQNLKEKLAREYKYNRRMYTYSKAEFIKKVLNKEEL